MMKLRRIKSRREKKANSVRRIWSSIRTIDFRLTNSFSLLVWLKFITFEEKKLYNNLQYFPLVR